MKRILIATSLILTSCVAPQPTIEQYCGQTLGLKYGTTAYANCGMQYSQMRINAYNAKANMVSAINAGQPSTVYVRQGY
jgi:hypothetical protein